MSGSVSPQTDYFVSADPDYPVYLARLMGVSVMTEDEFVKTFANLNEGKERIHGSEKILLIRNRQT